MYSDGKYQVTFGGYVVKEKVIESRTISCDSYHVVCGKVLTELWQDKDKKICLSYLIPISNIIKIMDGDIKCM